MNQKKILFLKILVAMFCVKGLAQQRNWTVYSLDSLSTATHYWNDGTERLDSLILRSNNKKINFSKVNENFNNVELISTYKDSLSMPFDFKIPEIISISNLDDSTLILIGKNKGIDKLFSNYLHIILVQPSKNEIESWLTGMVSRSADNPKIFIDLDKKELIIPKENNYFLEDKLYSIDYCNKKHKEISLNRSTKYLEINSSGPIENHSSTFLISY